MFIQKGLDVSEIASKSPINYRSLWNICSHWSGICGWSTEDNTSWIILVQNLSQLGDMLLQNLILGVMHVMKWRNMRQQALLLQCSSGIGRLMNVI